MANGLVFTYDDLGNMHIPMRAFYAQCLASGKDFSWWPGIFCGYNLLGDGQVGMYHPLHRLIYGELDFTTAFNIEFLLSYPFALVGMYLFLRRWRLRRDAAMLGALMFAFCGFNTMHFMHVNMVAVAAHIPWLLFAIDVLLKADTRRVAAVAGLAVAMLTASQILLGFPQMVQFSVFVEILYVVLLMPRWSVRALGALMAAKAAGVIMGAVQILPTYELFLDSMRWKTEGYSNVMLSLTPINLVQLVAPYLFRDRIVSTGENCAHTQELAVYCGAVGLVLFAWVASRLWGRHAAWAHGDEKRRFAMGAVALAALGIVLMLGKYGELYLLVTKIPLVGSFRAPARYIVFVQIAIAVAAALAFDALCDQRRRGGGAGGVRGAVLALPALAVAATLLAGWPARGAWAILAPDAESSWRLLAAGPLAMALAAIIVIAASRGGRLALGAIVVVAAVDQGVYGLSFIYSSPPRSMESFTQTVGLPEVPTPYRMEAIPTYDDVAALAGYRQVTGHTGLWPKKALDYTRTTPLRLASTMLEVIKSDAPSEGGVATMKLVGVRDTMPKARFVSKAIVSADPSAMLEGIDVATTAIVDEAIDIEEGPPGAAELIRDEPGDIAVTVDAAMRQLLVVSESYSVGWRAKVDGQAAKVIRAYGDFMGVIINKGRHEITLEFEAPARRTGRYISEVSLILVFGAFALALFGRRRKLP